MLSRIRLRGQFPTGDRLHRYLQQLLGHMLFLDSVYIDGPRSAAQFRWVSAPTSNDRLQKKLPFVGFQGKAEVGRFSPLPTPTRNGFNHAMNGR